jgi:hypothetical protein
MPNGFMEPHEADSCPPPPENGTDRQTRVDVNGKKLVK